MSYFWLSMSSVTLFYLCPFFMVPFRGVCLKGFNSWQDNVLFSSKFQPLLLGGNGITNNRVLQSFRIFYLMIYYTDWKYTVNSMQILCKERDWTEQIRIYWNVIRLGLNSVLFWLKNRSQRSRKKDSEEKENGDLPSHEKLLNCCGLRYNILEVFRNRTVCQISMIDLELLTFPHKDYLLSMQAYWWNIFAKIGIIYKGL